MVGRLSTLKGRWDISFEDFYRTKTWEVTLMDQTITALNISSDEADPILIYINGVGCRPDGKGSEFAWIQPFSGERHKEKIDGLTNRQAEYRALISALLPLPNGSSAQIFTDSPRLYGHVMGLTHVRDARLAALLRQVRRLIKRSGLTIDLRCTSPGKNLARGLL